MSPKGTQEPKDPKAQNALGPKGHNCLSLWSGLWAQGSKGPQGHETLVAGKSLATHALSTHFEETLKAFGPLGPLRPWALCALGLDGLLSLRALLPLGSLGPQGFSEAELTSPGSRGSEMCSPPRGHIP